MIFVFYFSFLYVCFVREKKGHHPSLRRLAGPGTEASSRGPGWKRRLLVLDFRLEKTND